MKEFFLLIFNWLNIAVLLIGLGITFWYQKKYKKTKSRPLLTGLPGVWTSLGLLGTFISICRSLYGLGNNPEVIDNTGKTLAELKELNGQDIDIIEIIDKLIPAFTTSIIGLVFALFSTIKSKMIFAKEEAEENSKLGYTTPEEHIREIAENSKELTSYKSIMKDHNVLLTELIKLQKQQEEKNREYNDKLNDNISHQSEILKEFIDGFVKRMDDIFKQMQDSIQQQVHDFGEEQFVKSSEVLNGIIEKMSTESASLLEEQKNSVEKMVTATSSELNTISIKLSGVVDSLSSSTIETLKNLGENQSAELQQLAIKYDVLAEKLVNQNATYAENVNKLMTEQFAAVEAKNAESLEKMIALKDSYQTACTDLLNKSTEANEQIISEFKDSFGTFVQELQASMASQCSILSKSIADNVKTLDSSYSFMKEHLAEMVANYEQSAEAFKDAVNVAHRTNESSENAIAKVTNALENIKTTNETLEKVIKTVATKQTNVDKIVANIKEMNSTIEALQQLESVLNRIAKKWEK